MTLMKEDAFLVEQAQQGDEQAFAKLVDSYKDMVFRTSMGFLHDEDDANDLTQDVFVQMYNSLNEFRGDAKLSTWLYRIAVNKSLNVIRSRKNRSWMQSIENFFGGESGDLQVEDDFERTDKCVENQDRAKALHQAMEKLPEKQRTAFILSKYEDLSYAEIAEVMKVSISSVESLLHRAKTNLQKRLVHIYKHL